MSWFEPKAGQNIVVKPGQVKLVMKSCVDCTFIDKLLPQKFSDHGWYFQGGHDPPLFFPGWEVAHPAPTCRRPYINNWIVQPVSHSSSLIKSQPSRSTRLSSI